MEWMLCWQGELSRVSGLHGDGCKHETWPCPLHARSRYVPQLGYAAERAPPIGGASRNLSKYIVRKLLYPGKSQTCSGCSSASLRSPQQRLRFQGSPRSDLRNQETGELIPLKYLIYPVLYFIEYDLWPHISLQGRPPLAATDRSPLFSPVFLVPQSLLLPLSSS